MCQSIFVFWKKFEKVRKNGKKWGFKKLYIITEADAKHTLICISFHFFFSFFFLPSETNIQKLIIQNWKFNIAIDIQNSLRIMGLRIVVHLGISNFHKQLFPSDWYHHGQLIIWFPL